MSAPLHVPPRRAKHRRYRLRRTCACASTIVPFRGGVVCARCGAPLVRELEGATR